MAYLACPNCKFISHEWPDKDNLWTSHVFRNEPFNCRNCFHTMKILIGKAPDTCKHGRPFTIRCWECIKEEQLKEQNNEIKNLQETKKELKIKQLKEQIEKLSDKHG